MQRAGEVSLMDTLEFSSQQVLKPRTEARRDEVLLELTGAQGLGLACREGADPCSRPSSTGGSSVGRGGQMTPAQQRGWAGKGQPEPRQSSSTRISLPQPRNPRCTPHLGFGEGFHPLFPELAQSCECPASPWP